MAEYRQWRNENRNYLKDVIPLDTPYNLKVEVSSLCNAKCVYCAHSKEDHGVYEGNMSIELMEKILEDSKEFPSKYKVMEMFSFGEALCNPNLPKMIAMARKAEVTEKINFTTNGLLLTKSKIDEIVEAGPDIIRISLQGLDAETYWDVCKVKINYEEFLTNLKYLYEHKGKCNIRMKIPDVSLRNAEEDRIKFEDTFGPIADMIFIEKIIPMYADVDYKKIGQSVYDNAINGRENIEQHTIHTVCNRPFYRMRVSADGKVTAACCDIPNDFYYGSIYEKTLVDIWNSEARKNLLKMQLLGKRFEHPICKKCSIPNDITTEADILDNYQMELYNRIFEE